MSTRTDQLKNLGIIDSESDLSQKSKQLIEGMSESEFNAIITARAKISDVNHRDDFDQSVSNHGF